MLAEALIKCHENSIQSGGRRFQLKQFVAGRNRLENEGAQALAQAFEVNSNDKLFKINDMIKKIFYRDF